MADSPGIRAFARAIREQWLAGMTGALSVPFAILAAFTEGYQQYLVIGLMFAALLYAAYNIWAAERSARNGVEGRNLKQAVLDHISRLRQEMVVLRIEMEKPEADAEPAEFWQNRFKELEGRISTKITEYVSEAEATNYRIRGNITRRRAGTRQHQLFVDLAIHDIDHLKQFISDYSRNHSRAN